MDEDEELPPGLKRNSRIVSRACDKFFAAKGMRCYDIKGNIINPTTKQPIDKPKCKPTSKDSKP
jgi:hypothetical protein